MSEAALKDKTCEACQSAKEPLKGDALKELAGQVDDWSVENEHHLERKFEFDDFRQALDFTNAIGEIAEAENHHPIITLTWGEVTVKIWTHKIDGLTESDFVLAAKMDEAKKAA